jgi:anaerobic magnesium-protoporphyrin IX monomethyl ester cyclase
MICVGEGEGAMLELCESLEADRDITTISNLWVKQGQQVHTNAPRPLIEDLDRLPFPDTHIFDYPNLETSKRGLAPVMASRGCDKACTYCCNHKIRSVYRNHSHYVRFRSVENVLRNIQTLLTEYPFIRFINFVDDILPLRRDWFRQFAQEYRKQIGLPFRSKCRPDLLSEEVIQLLKEAGCQHIKLGVESGNKYLRTQILRRKITDEQIINAFDLCHRYDIASTSYNMVGLPFEDMPAILDTIKLNARLRPRLIQRTIYYPYCHTELYDLCQAKGFLTERRYDSYKEGTILTQPGLTATQVQFTYEAFNFLVHVYTKCNLFPGNLKTHSIRWVDRLVSSRLTPYHFLASALRMIKELLRFYRRRKFYRPS